MSVLQGWEIQRRVIHAVMMREVRTRFGRNRLGYLWAFAEPLFWIATFAGVRLVTGSSPPNGMDTISFLATGIINFILFRSTVTHCLAAIFVNKPLYFYPQVRPLSIVLARSMLELSTLVIVFVAVLTANGLYQGELRVDDLMRVILALLMSWLLGVGLGMFTMGLTVYTAAVERIVPLLMRPMLFISGMFFTAGELPSEIREVLIYNPVLQTAELLRDGWFREFHTGYFSLGYVAGWILLLVYLGLLFERFARRRMQLT